MMICLYQGCRFCMGSPAQTGRWIKNMQGCIFCTGSPAKGEGGGDKNIWENGKEMKMNNGQNIPPWFVTLISKNHRKLLGLMKYIFKTGNTVSLTSVKFMIFKLNCTLQRWVLKKSSIANSSLVARSNFF